jgi:hypothetical protein
MNSLLPGARDSTIYWFTDDNKPRLMEITYKYNAGGPEFLELLQRRYAENRNEFRIVEYHDVAPGRRWFDAWIAYSGRDDLLVSVRATAAEDAPISIQKIDTRTGEVLWSTPVPPPPERLSPWTGHYLRESVRVGDRYILKYEGHNYWILAADGTLLKEIKNLNSR